MTTRPESRSQVDREAGMAMIMVIGIMVFIFGLIVTATAYAVNGLGQSRKRVTYEQSLAVAENGIDQVMSAVQKQYSATFTDFPVPDTSGGLGCVVGGTDLAAYQFPAFIGSTQVSNGNGEFYDAGGRTAEENERTWAREKLNALKAQGCVQSGPTGEFVVLKPKSPAGSSGKFGRIYSLGAVPSFAAPAAKERLLKSEYVFVPYRPNNAILTSGNLEFQGSFTIGQAAGTTGNIAHVHSNGSIDITGNSGTVMGRVTATGTVSGSTNAQGPIAGAQEKQTVPVVSARAFYTQAAGADPSVLASWYDLCPDGSVRAYSAGGPCTAATTIASGTFNNWTWNASATTWTAGAGVTPGTYFVHEADVTNGTGNGSEPKLTVVASSKNVDNCSSKRYGNIIWDHYDLLTPAYPNMWLYADGDVSVTSNIRVGSNTAPVVSGGVIAGDQVYLYTQSNSAVGAVVAGDRCTTTADSPNPVPKNVVHSDLYYDGGADLPLASIITNTLWLDYSG